MPFLSDGRLYQVQTTNPRTKSLIAQYWGDAVNHFLSTGDTLKLGPYERWRIGGMRFETDPSAIEDFISSTDFDFQEFYEP
jgi:hypothetical protein